VKLGAITEMSRKFPSAFEAASLNSDKLGVRDGPPSSPIRLLSAVIYRAGNELESALEMPLAHNDPTGLITAIKIFIHHEKDFAALSPQRRKKKISLNLSHFIKNILVFVCAL